MLWPFRICLGALLTTAAIGQNAAPTPTFEAADVRVAPKSSNQGMRGGVLRGVRYEIRNASMVDLIATAYGVEAEKVVGGPSWLEIDRFDIAAKAPAGTATEKVNQMLQSLLADRFKLVLRKEDKVQPGFTLSLGKGKHKLKEGDASAPSNCQGVPQTPAPGTVPYQVVACKNMTMEAFAPFTRQLANAYVTAPAINKTGLEGAWDFELKWTGRGALAQAGPDGITFFDAVDKQLGLLLESGNVVTSVYTVESVNREPTPNDPKLTQSLPPAPPAEFEVATIKPGRPDGPQRANLQAGRLDTEGIPLKLLIRVAWDMLSDDLIVDAPGFLDTARYDISAKASTDNAANGQIDIETVRVMLQALLKERFNLKVHTEEREVPAYTLKAGKSKLKAANPETRSSCKEGPAPAARDLRNATPIRSRLITCLNMTLEQFAERLQGLASGYLSTPVSDSTGLSGAYDFTLNFSPIGAYQAAGLAPPAAAVGAATAEPSLAISLFEAVDDQLGLKLEKQKRKMPVLVIDHMDEVPTEN